MEHVAELIAAHALRALDPDEEARVEQHVAECPECMAALRELEAVASALAYAAPRAQPPAELRTRVLASVAPVVAAQPEAERPLAAKRPGRSRMPAWWPRFSAVAVPVLAVAVVGLLIWNISLQGQPTGFAVGTAALPGVGNVVAQKSGQATLYAQNLAPPPSGKTYEAWVITNGKAAPAGTFGGGTRAVALSHPAHPGDTIAVTVEPAPGTGAPTSTPISSSKI